MKIDRLWGGSIGNGLGKQFVRMPPGVLADRVFAADGFGYVEARERFKGKKLWSARIGKDDKGLFSLLNPFDRRDTSFVTGGVGAGEGLVMLGTTHAEVIALSAADGSEKWRVRVSSEVLSTPVTGDGLVFVQTSDGRLVALDANDGARRWTFDTQVPVLTLRGTGSPVYSSGVVVAGFANGKVTAFRATTGEPLWDQRVMLPQGRSELDRIVDVDGTPVITANAVYAASFQGRLSAIRPTDGTVLWERDASSYVDLAQGYGQRLRRRRQERDHRDRSAHVERRVGAARAVQARTVGRCGGRLATWWSATKTVSSTCCRKLTDISSAGARSTATASVRSRSLPTTSSIASATAAI